jgi:hypothetical protein
MDSYEALRRQAVEKRDSIINAAKRDCRLTIRRIKELQRQMGPVVIRRRKKSHKPIWVLIRDLIPKDRMFTIGDVVELMQEAEPDRSFNVPTINVEFRRLEKQGLVRRVRRVVGNVLWAATEANVPDTPYGAKPIADVAESVLRDRGPLTTAELSVAIQGRGFRSDLTPRQLYDSLLIALRRGRDRFIKSGAKWSICQ